MCFQDLQDAGLEASASRVPQQNMVRAEAGAHSTVSCDMVLFSVLTCNSSVVFACILISFISSMVDLMEGYLLGAFIRKDIRSFKYLVTLAQRLGSAKLAGDCPEDEGKILALERSNENAIIDFTTSLGLRFTPVRFLALELGVHLERPHMMLSD